MTVIPPACAMPERLKGAPRRAPRLAVEDRRYALLIAHDAARKGRIHPEGDDAAGRAVDLKVAGEIAAPRRTARPGQGGQPTRCIAAGAAGSAPFSRRRFCVFPTSGDTFGMVPLEAMAHGLPVIVSSGRHCGFAHYVTHGVDALVLEDPGDADALAKAMGRLLAEPELRERLAGSGRALARKMGWDGVAARYSQLYRRLLAG